MNRKHPAHSALMQCVVPHIALLLTLLGVAPGAAAEDVFPEIALSKNGNYSSHIPLDKPFILTGDVGEEVRAVRAVFVRYAFNAWGFPPPKRSPIRTCDDVFAAVELGGLREEEALGLRTFGNVFNSPRVARVELIESLTAATTAEEKNAVYKKQAKAVNDAESAYKALDKAGVYNVVSLRTDTFGEIDKDKKQKKFALQVSARGFFRNGASYCLLVYQERLSGEKIGKQLLELAKKKIEEFEKCEEAAEPDSVVCPQIDELHKMIKEILKDNGISENKASELTAVLANVPTALDDSAKQLNEMVAKEAPIPIRERLLAFEPGERFLLAHNEGSSGGAAAGVEGERARDATTSAPAGSTGASSSAEESLANFVLQVLATNLVVQRQYAPDPAQVGGRKPEFIVDNFVVRAIAFEKDAAVIVLMGAEPKQRREVADLEKYKLPGFSTVTLRDVVELSRGRVIVGGEAMGFAAIHTKSDRDKVRVLFPAEAAKSEEARKARDAVVDHLKTIEMLLKHAISGKPLAASNAGGVADVYGDLARWLGANVEPIGSGENKEALELLRSFIGDLQARIAAHGMNVERFHALPSEVDLASQKVMMDPYVQTSVGQAFGFGETEFFSSYVTPTLGLAFILHAHERFALPYVGAQIYLWPNRFDEPMWTNGRSDFRRMFGLEFGLGLSGFPSYNTAFGADNQYRPLSERYSTPPVLLGLAIQPLPYVTTTLGWAFMRRAPTGLVRETPEPFTSFFVSITVQLNFFNAVRTLVLDRNAAELKPALFPASK